MLRLDKYLLHCLHLKKYLPEKLKFWIYGYPHIRSLKLCAAVCLSSVYIFGVESRKNCKNMHCVVSLD